MVLFGYSPGSGLTARLAYKFGAKKLFLLAPYFIGAKQNALCAKLFMKYKIPMFGFVLGPKDTDTAILHGRNDKLIGIENSYELAKLLRPNDEFGSVVIDH